MKISQQIIIGIISALALYVLSIGPVSAYYGHTKATPPPAVRNFYHPLFLCYANSTVIRHAFNWYFSLWFASFPAAP